LYTYYIKCVNGQSEQRTNEQKSRKNHKNVGKEVRITDTFSKQQQITNKKKELYLLKI